MDQKPKKGQESKPKRKRARKGPLSNYEAGAITRKKVIDGNRRALAVKAEKTPLSLQEEIFVKAIFSVDEHGNHRSRSEAYALAYPGENPGTHSKVSSRPHVKAAILRMRQEILDEVLNDDALAHGVASQRARLTSKNHRWFGLRQIILERAQFYREWRERADKIEKQVAGTLAEVAEFMATSTGDESGQSMTIGGLARKIMAIERSIRELRAEDDEMSDQLPVFEEFESVKQAVVRLDDVLEMVARMRVEMDELSLATPVPGAETGLMFHTDKKTKYGIEREWKVDQVVLNEMRSIETVVAEELGQVAPKKTDITTGGQPITAAFLLMLPTMSNDELESRIAALEQRRNTIISPTP